MNQRLLEYLMSYSLTTEETQRALSCFTPLSCRKNQILLPPGEVCRHIYFIEKGSLRMFFMDTAGHEATRHIAFDGSFGTALSSFITQKPSSEYVQVLEPSELWQIEYDDFFRLTQQMTAWQTMYQRILERAVDLYTQRFMTFTQMDVRQRYEWLLQFNPAMVQRLPNHIVASYLNTSPETLSRVKAQR